MSETSSILPARAVDAPQEKGHTYEELFELAPDAYLFTSLSGRIVRANRAAFALLNCPPRTLVGAPLSAFLVYPAYAALVQEVPAAPLDALPSEREVRVRPVRRPSLPVGLTLGVARDDHRRRYGYRWLLRDITERERADAARAGDGGAAASDTIQELTRQRDRLRRMYTSTLDAREQEARRIGRELHDQAGQILGSLHGALDEIGADLGPPGRERVARLRDMVDDVEQQLRRIAHEMRPPILDDLGLLPALDFMARGLGRRSRLTVRVLGTAKRISPEIETNLYRFAQEALNNVVRHAGARQAWVELQVRRRHATIEVRDDGRGFVVEDVLRRQGDRGIGLLGMQERVDALGGRLDVESAPGSITRVRATVPL